MIPLYHTAVKALSDYVRTIRPQLIADSEETALFVNMSGERMSRQGFWKIIKYYQERAGIEKDITPHTPVSYTHLGLPGRDTAASCCYVPWPAAFWQACWAGENGAASGGAADRRLW